MVSSNSIEIRGFNELYAKLKNLPPELLKKVLEPGLKKGSTTLRDAAKSQLSGQLRNKSGNLRRNLVAQKGQASLFETQYWVYVRNKAYYGYMWEKGFKRVARGQNKGKGKKRVRGRRVVRFESPRPFMRPAMDLNRQKILDNIGIRIEKALKKL